MMAHHDTLIEEDDHVIMFVSDRRQIDEVERLFEVDGSD
jgi:trk system potassium uptake protein TrkA